MCNHIEHFALQVKKSMAGIKYVLAERKRIQKIIEQKESAQSV
jgi:hypothetical protein